MSRVLIVDDKEENLYYLQALLSAHGHDVDTARHGAEALVKARQFPPDLVVSDLLMPIMDGYTLLRHWKADPLLHSIKFVVYTATYIEASDEHLALSLGADAFILKPSEPVHFVSRITEVLAKPAPAPSPIRPPDGDQSALMQSYSETLIRKLEEKTLQLQESNRALLQDIAVREQAEDRLRLLNFAILQSTEAVLITDAELDAPGPRIVFANPAFIRLTGYALDEIIGKTPRILQGPRTDQAVLRRLRTQLERGETFFGEAVNYRKDGSEYEQEWQVAPILDAQGNTTHYVAVQRDITERSRAAQALLDSNREQQQLAAQLEQERQRLLDAQRVAKVGSWENNLATGSLIWSDETHRIHETQPGTFQPTHARFLELVHPDDRARVDQALAESVEAGSGGVIEHRLLLPDGRIKHVEERWQIKFEDNGTPVRALGTCQDVSERKQADLVLRNTVDRLALATQSAQIGIWDWDVVGNTLVWDEQMLRLYGMDAGEFGEVYEVWTQSIHPDDRERVQAEMVDAIAGIGEYRTQFRIVRPDGELRDIEANGLVQRATDGTALRMIGVNRDISEQMQADRRIRYLNRVHAMTSSVNGLIVRARDRDELFQEACRIAVEAGGFRVAMIGVVVPGGLDYVAFDGTNNDAVLAVQSVMASRAAAPSPMAARAMRDRVASVSNASQLDPDVIYQDMHVRYGIHSMAILPLLVDSVPAGVIALYAAEADFFHVEEIALLTELAGDVALAIDHLDKRDRLAFLDYYDALTGLANRSLLLERVGQYARSAASMDGQLAVLIFDLERFKNINDSLGRAAGDELLRKVAAWLTAHLGDANLLARIDADHFGLVLPAGWGSGDFAHEIERMMAAFLGKSFEVKGENLRIAARAGIAMYPADGKNAEALFERAEAALKKANASGARYLFYAQQMTDAVAGRLALESQLRNALENEEFVLHYQPKVNLRSGLLSGAEALIRWNNPHGGLMPPGLFIPILEETGMINDVGRWALQQAISDWLRWRRGGLPAVPIAVNVSPMQLRDPTFISQLQAMIAVTGEAAQGLELEITESMIMDDVKQSIASLKAIRGMGISVAIDDFGTGFSSLGYLGKLPIDTLKIDRSFIVDMVASADGLSLVSTMLMLAHSLKLKVVAEGVETAEQASLLGSLKCDEIQGYLISRPLDCAEFESRFLSPGWRMP
jgi:diguanylate cyclase (GGDEF)-like protein/PAS domain S-box-containing protein